MGSLVANGQLVLVGVLAFAFLVWLANKLYSYGYSTLSDELPQMFTEATLINIPGYSQKAINVGLSFMDEVKRLKLHKKCPDISSAALLIPSFVASWVDSESEDDICSAGNGINLVLQKLERNIDDQAVAEFYSIVIRYLEGDLLSISV